MQQFYKPPLLHNLIVSIVIFTLSACSSNSDSPNSGIAAPTISAFSASAATISVGESVVLIAEFQGGNGTINNGVGAVVSGQATIVTPSQTTEYTLIVTNVNNETIFQQLTVTVESVVSAPVIMGFIATPTIILTGNNATLTATFENGSGVIDNGVGTVLSGSAITVSPAVTTTYKLTVTNKNNVSVSQQVVLSVGNTTPAPLISGFDAAPSIITAGATSTLTATFENGNGVIDNGVGTVSSGSAVTVSPTATTTYTLTVTNTDNVSVSQQIVLSVENSAPAPVITSFVANPSQIDQGGSAILIATFQNGEGVINNGVGSVSSGAEYVVSPAVTTTYLLTVSDNSGTTQSAPITVIVNGSVTSPKLPIGTSSSVNAIVKDASGATYIGGSFTHTGYAISRGVPLDPITGAINNGFPPINNTVRAAVSDGNGGWYIGGSFTQIAGIARNHIAHILANGSLDMNWDPNVNGDVIAITINGNSVFAGGSFSRVNQSTASNASRSGLVEFNDTDGTVSSWAPASTGTVNSLLVHEGKLYVAGSNVTAYDLVTMNTTAWNPDPFGQIYSMVGVNQTIYLGGRFSRMNGVTTRNNLAAVDAETGLLTAWDPNVNRNVFSLDTDGIHIFAGGDFKMVNGSVSRVRAAAFDLSTGIASDWNPTINNDVTSLVVGGDSVFMAIDSFFVSEKFLVAYNKNNGRLLPWNATVSNPASVVAYDGSTVYAGGEFLLFDAIATNTLARILPDGRIDEQFANIVSGWVFDLAIEGSTLYIAGDIYAARAGNLLAVDRRGLAAIDLTTLTATAWAPELNYFATTLHIDGENIYAGGLFTTVNSGSTTRKYVASFNKTDGLATTWNPDPDKEVNAISSSSSAIFLGGIFTSVNNSSTPHAQNYLASFNKTDGLVNTAWAANRLSPVYALAVSSDTVYAGGPFNATASSALTAYSLTDASTQNWNPGVSGIVDVLLINGSTIYAGGSFNSVNKLSTTLTRNSLAAFNISDATATSWNPNVNGKVVSLYHDVSTIYAGGIFSSANMPTISTGRFAKFSVTDGSLILD